MERLFPFFSSNTRPGWLGVFAALTRWVLINCLILAAYTAAVSLTVKAVF